MTYTPLDRNEFRLCSIDVPDDPGMSIRVNTRIASLAISSRPKFKALYAGKTSEGFDRRSLILNGSRIFVTKHLDSALRLLHHHEQQSAWVEEICVNHDDEEEKTQQATLVGKIFAAADELLAWVGDSSRWINGGLNFLQAWAKVDCNFDDLAQVQALMKKPELWKRQSWQQADDLFEMPFWRQRWLVQQLVLARQSAILCAKRKIPLADLERVVEMWKTLEEPRFAKIIGNNINAMAPAVAASRRLRLHSSLLSRRKKPGYWPGVLNLVELCQDTQISNYSPAQLTALSRTAEKPDDIADDTRCVRKMLIDFAAGAINDCDHLKILERAGIADLDAVERFDLPSWVPTWEKEASSPLRRLYDASGHSKAVCNFGEDEVLGEQNVLRFFATGVKCGTVLEVDSAETMAENPFRMLGGEYRKYRLNQKYPTGMPGLQAIFRTMILDQIPKVERRLTPARKEFFDLAAGFLFMLQYMDKKSPEDLLKTVLDQDLSAGNKDDSIPDYAKSFMKYSRKTAENGKVVLSEILEPFLGSSSSPTKIEWPEEHDNERGFAYTMPFLAEAARCLKGRTMFALNKGYFGVGPLGTQPGDTVCVLWGCDVPVVIRRLEDHYVLVGPCFVLGFMDGEMRKMVDQGLKKEKIFNFR
ncbi:hypothetical protein HYALB_00010282 [Hymenoscyphus albidus]|uniref:Heterokaryon incompatibility domain-containing protein n=1 Tax=Hymenoscyphus albidus TaxID=595503 RepID=A0A9N9Q7S0_9HELO|nr:hypothetical protein HYALB_00010282 [Hymenoscyphus albidus]